MSATNSTFQAAIPGSSLAHHKLGSLPHEKPPKFTDPNEASEYLWKQFHRPEILKQIWYVFEKGATVHAVAAAILYKAASMGIIQMNLAVVIRPVIGTMLLTLAKAKGIDPKIAPKYKDKTQDNILHDHINSHFKGRTGPVPPSALKTMQTPKPEDFDKSDNFMGKLEPGAKQEASKTGLLNNMQGE